jgi:hypothetical protein
MEHLCLPAHAESFIAAPYEAPKGEQYKGDGFLAFPYQRGWTEKQIFGDDKESKKEFKPGLKNQEIEFFLRHGCFSDSLLMS